MDLKIEALLFTTIGHYVLSLDESTQCCSSRPTECCQYRSPDCLDYRDSGETRSGVYRIIPPDMHTGYEVYCDMETDGGGWMVFQRREDGSEDFYRDWDDYEAGFGNVSHEHWLGFMPLKKLMYSGDYELRIDLKDWQNETRYAKYSVLSIDFKYEFRLRALGYNGTAGDAMKYHNGRFFSTYNKNANDCAERRRGAWWYLNCAEANLNGGYYDNGKDIHLGIFWKKWPNNKAYGYYYPLKRTEMKIRRL